MAEPSVDKLKTAIKEILKGADLDSLSAKKVRKMLEEKFKADFSERKKEIDKLVMKMIDEDEEEEDEDKDDEDKEDENGVEGGGAGSDAESGDEVPKKKAKKAPASSSSASKLKKRKSAGKADDSEDPVMSSIKQMDDEDLAKKLQDEETGLRRRRAAAPKPKKEREKNTDKNKKPSLYSRPCQLSEQLAAVVGTNEMPRPEVVKTLWSIVKERNLQDPENKQFMLCDAQMESLFGMSQVLSKFVGASFSDRNRGSKRIKLFGMMKYLKKHIIDLPR